MSMIKLPRHNPPFPHAAPVETRRNAWGTQWQTVPRAAVHLVRTAEGIGLRRVRDI